MTKLWYEAAGDGPPLVLVHAGIADARMWDGVWHALAARHRVVKCDLRGFGRTGAAHGSFAAHTDVAHLLDEVGLERAALCGVSYGGAVCLETALAYPDRVSALVLACCAVDWSTAPEGLVERIREADAFGEAGELDRAVELELRIWIDGERRQAPVDPGVRGLVREMNTLVWELDRESDGEQVRLVPPVAGRLGEVGCPTLVVAGEYDVTWMTESARAIAAAIPDSRFELVEGVAHLPPLERPDAFARLLLEFEPLARH